MKNVRVELYVRVRREDGSHPYLKAAFAPNGRLRPNHGLCGGKATHFRECSYHLRYRANGKRVWEPVGSDASLALVARQKRQHEVEGQALGLTGPAPESIRDGSLERKILRDAVATYIAEVREHKEAKTFSAYSKTLALFEEIRPKINFVDEIRREDLLAFIAALRKRGNGPRTLRNRVDYLQIFLHHLGLPSLLKGSDLPKFTKKKVQAYQPEVLAKMFAAATQDEADLLHFLLCTGAREKEAQFACWTDVDLEQKTYKVTEHLDLGYRPKDKEEGILPIPDVLVNVLKARRERYPRSRLIFSGKGGGPNGHALRIIKRLALRAGVNCGHCVSKAGKSCATSPVCRHIRLHKARKTFATNVHNNGLPAQTVQRYLRHSDIATTLEYLADQADDLVLEALNRAFVAEAA